MLDNTTTQTAAERLRASTVDARMFGEGLQHNQYSGHYGAGVQIVRQAEQIRVLVEALEELEGWHSREQGIRKWGGAPRPDDAIRVAAQISRAALDAAWALEEE